MKKKQELLRLTKAYLFTIFFIICFVMISNQQIYAKTIKSIPLNNNKTIKKYDVTGDKKKDSIKICSDNMDPYEIEYGRNWKININGKIAIDFGDVFCKPDVSLYKCSSKRVYLHVVLRDMNNGDIHESSLFQYKKGKLVKVCDMFQAVLKNFDAFHYGIEIKKMKSKTMVIQCRNQMSSTALIYWTMKYKYSKGKWKRTSKKYKVKYIYKTNEWTATRKITTYTKPGGKKKSFTIQVKDLVKINYICIKKGKTYIQVTDKNGKKGWYRDPQKYTGGYFEEALFAG